MDVFVYVVPLQGGVKGFTAPCIDGYTIYIDSELDGESKRQVYQHELQHIRQGDFSEGDVQEIELRTHEEG